MVRAIFGAWIPRSYLHVYELSKKVENMPFKILNFKLGESVSFEFKEDNTLFKFELNGSGLYTLEAEINKNEINEFFKKAKEILIHKIISAAHSVTYKQILSKALPLSSSMIVFSSQKNDHKAYVYKTEIIHIKEKATEKEVDFAKMHLQTVLFSQFIYLMMERMEGLYNNAHNISSLIEQEAKLSDVRKAILGMDLIKKNVVESKAKIKQMNTILEHERGMFESNKNKTKLFKELKTEKLYEEITLDRAYVEDLWELLIDFLENIDAAAESRLSYQETIESKMIETILGGEVAIALGIIVFGIFSDKTQGFAGIISLAVIFLVWKILSVLLKKIHMRIGSIRKIEPYN